MKDCKQQIESRLQRIANVLLLNASFTDNLGLLNGKMGIAIFFYRYARHTGNTTYENYAGELIDEIYEEMNQHTALNFANGQTGIAWGFEYLIKNGFVEAESDEVLSELDSAVFQGTIRLPVYIEKNDLFGFGLYYLARLGDRENDDDNVKVLFLKQMLVYMVDECERLLIHKKYEDIDIPYLNAGQVNSIIHFLLEVHRLRLFPVKVEKLFRYIPSFIETIISKNDDWADMKTLCHFAYTLFTVVTEIGLQNQYKIFADQLTTKIATTRNDEKMVDYFTKLSWHSLMYPVNYSNHQDVNLLIEKAFGTIDDEENWNQRLDKLSKDNLGLNSGLAGLGLGLMNSSQSAINN